MGRKGAEGLPSAQRGPHYNETTPRVETMSDHELRLQAGAVGRELSEVGFPLLPRQIIHLGEEIARKYGLSRDGHLFAPNRILCIEGIRDAYPTADGILAQIRDPNVEKAIQSLTTINREWIRRNGEPFFGPNHSL